MKKYLLPIILAVAGVVLLILPMFQSSGEIDVKIQPATVIMPAAYKVYANPNVAGGRYNLFKAVVKNTGAGEIKNFKVQFRVPGLIDNWADVPTATNLLPGQTAVVTCFPVFPQSITERNTSSKEKTEIKFLYGGQANPTEHDESFTFDMTSVNDIVFTNMADQDKAGFNDMAENRDIYACMVSAEDPIIKHYAETVQQKILCGEQGAGVGGNGQITDKDLAEKVRVMQGVYNATLISRMVYSETQTSVTQFGDNTSSTEHIRLPREVVSGNTGLCIELAILHASVYKAAGLDPVIFLIPGHAYPGIKVGNQYVAIESTGIGGVGLGSIMNADQALQSGMNELKTFYQEASKGNPAYKLLDINELYAQGYQDMELKPDPILAGEADKITQTWPVCLLSAIAEAQKAAPAARRTAYAPRPRNNNDNNRPSSSGWTSYSLSNVSVSYPADWKVLFRPVAQFPAIVMMAVSADKTGMVELYNVPGAYNPEQAAAYIRTSLARMGENVTYSEAGNYNGFTRFNGTTYNGQATLKWVGFFKNSNSGVEGVVVGTPGGGNNAVLNQIVGSIQ
ncbi:MAG TPA: hypothetical protein VFE53_27075 [Mucilaginibacter sp.]|jgi:hypothetical protein|nr:hypothetical protein [Mucilaginibacter sp.]